MKSFGGHFTASPPRVLWFVGTPYNAHIWRYLVLEAHTQSLRLGKAKSLFTLCSKCVGEALEYHVIGTASQHPASWQQQAYPPQASKSTEQG